MRRTLLIAGLIVVSIPFAFAWYALAARFVLHGPVNRDTLATSIDREAAFGLIATARCEGKPWRTCFVYDDSGGGVSYAVMVDDDSSCWDARMLANNSYEVPDPPPTLSGCVHLWQWSLL